MAPEQATASPQTDHRADIYAIGVVAYEMLTGLPPFSGRSVQAVLAAQVVEDPEPVERRRPAVPPTMAALVRDCLAKRPADRPQTASDVMHQHCCHCHSSGGTAATTAVRVPVPPGADAMGWRHRWPPLPASVLALALVLGGVLWRQRGVTPRMIPQPVLLLPAPVAPAEKALPPVPAPPPVAAPQVSPSPAAAPPPKAGRSATPRPRRDPAGPPCCHRSRWIP